MAIDTAAKRASCLGLALLFLRTGVPGPDGSDLSAPQRLHAQALYSGIAADAPAAVVNFIRATFVSVSPVVTFVARTASATFTAARARVTFTVLGE